MSASRTLRSFAVLALLGLWLLEAPPAVARAEGSEEPAAEAAADPRTELAARRSALAQEIRALEQQIEEQPGSIGLSPEFESLQELERTLARQAEVLDRAKQLEERFEQVEQRLAAGPEGHISQPPPYLLAVLDALADALDGERGREQTLEVARDAAKEALEAAEKTWKQTEKERRRMAEAAEGGKDAAQVARLRLALREAQRASRVAESRRDLSRAELAAFERELEIRRSEVELLEDTVAWVRENLSLEAAADPSSSAQLQELEFDARRQIEQAERQVAIHERRLENAQRQWDASPDSPALATEVDTRRAELHRWQLAGTTGAEALRDWEALALLLERRLKVLAGEIGRQQLLSWQTELEAERDELRRNLRLLEARRAELASERDQMQRAANDANRDEADWLGRHAKALTATLALLDNDRSRWDKIASTADRMLAEMKESSAEVSLAERSEDLARQGGELWRYELYVVEDQQITVGKIATGLLLFALGYLLARVVSRGLGRIVLRRMGFETGASTAIQKLVFYALVLLFFLFALRTVNIPLTVFTVLGGALAIGVGFGSQNIVNNFISGLILLAERPIKVGDMIEVEGTKGTVERIGPRSTRVRTFDNIHMIIPNSAFLEKNVVNWTLTDDDVRTHIDVGVAYGSSTREVQRFLSRAIADHGKVMQRPEPMVLFRDFGDDALLFRIYFWIRSRDMAERLTIESDIRYRIDHLFREAGITIAYPQRDVHLDATTPLELRVLPPLQPDTENS